MTFKERFFAWYDKHVVAAWYQSVSMWVGVIAAALPMLLDSAQAVLDQIGLLGGALALEPTTVFRIQLALALLIPPLRAWRQKSMQDAALVQAENVGSVVILDKTITAQG